MSDVTRRTILGSAGIATVGLVASPAILELTAMGAPMPTLIGDNTNYSKEPYLAYMGPWGAGTLVDGKDFTQQMKVYPSVFPSLTTLDWRWPEVSPSGAVRGFNKIDFGNYSGITVPNATIRPRQIKALSLLTVNFDLALAGDTRGFNVIIDLFLTRAAGNASSGQQVCEIEVFHNISDAAQTWFGGLTALGTATLSGRLWAVMKGGNDYAFAPVDGSQWLSGSFDLKGGLLWLVSQKQLTGSEWFNGLSLGAEPIHGAGSLIYNAFSVTYG